VQYVQSHWSKLGLVRPIVGSGLMLHELFYNHEVRAYGEQKWGASLEGQSAKPKELALAVQLIESQSEAFTLDGYTDTYQDRVTELIGARMNGAVEAVEVGPAMPVAKAAPVLDIMSALQQTLAAKTVKPPAKAAAKAS
jgi:non-homologous end joining protein Ku